MTVKSPLRFIEVVLSLSEGSAFEAGKLNPYPPLSKNTVEAH
jgi:hypothetical protein